MMINLMKVLRNVFVVQTTVPTGLSQKKCGVGQVRYVLCVVLWSRERVSSDLIRSRTCKKVKETGTTETFRNVEDGMWRWTYSTDVVCSALSCNGLREAANLARDIGERNSMSPCCEELNLIFLL